MSQKNNRAEINQWMRMWNRYKHYIVGAAAVLILSIIFLTAMALKGKNSGQEPSQMAQESSGKLVNPQDVTNATGNTQETPSTQAPEPSSETPTKPVNAPGGTVLTVTGKAQIEQFTDESFFVNSVFLGDGIASGVSAYGFLTEGQYIGNGNLITTKASDYVDAIAKANPEKIFTLMGVNDINYNNRSMGAIADSYSEVIKELKSKLPAAKIYIISVLPVGRSTAAVNVTMDKVNTLNEQLAQVAQTQGVYFIDLSKALVDDSGYLPSAISNNGLNIGRAYYAYILNAISQVAR